MLLTFNNASIEKIRAGQKSQTIRYNARRWEDWWTRRWQRGEKGILQVWHGNPRNSGRHIADTVCLMLSTLPGALFDQAHAENDGFISPFELWIALSNLHAMTLQEVVTHEWAIIRFDSTPVRKALQEPS